MAVKNNLKKATKRVGQAFGVSDINDKLAEVKNSINDNLSKTQESVDVLSQRMNEINRTNKIIEEQLKHLIVKAEKIEKLNNFYFYSLFKNPSESINDAKNRFFSGLPQASGNLLLIQKGNSKLLKALNEICQKYKIPYWASDGTLLGAVRHQGAIPWDDDVDVCMIRDDIHRLEQILTKTNYRITTIYDSINVSKQLRFRSENPDNPCFIDIFIYDYASENGESAWRKWQEKRNGIINDVRNSKDPRLIKWQKLIVVDHRDDSKLSRYLDDFYEKTYGDIFGDIHSGGPGNVATATEAKNDPEKFKYVIDGLDNLSPISKPDSPRIYKKSSIFPTKKLPYDDFQIPVPNKYHEYLENIYGDYLEIPDDMISHFHHVNYDDIDKTTIDNFLKSKK